MTARLLDVDAATYHRDELGQPGPSLSCSIAKLLITRSPAHARAAHPKLNPDFQQEEEAKFDVGRAAHSLFLEGDGNVEVFTYENWATKAAKEGRAEARAHGKTPMLGKDWDKVQAMVLALEDGLNALKISPPLFSEGKAEQTVLWEDAGVHCRARLDWLRNDSSYIDDLKTSHNANPDNWTRRTMYDIGADFQVAWYRRGVRAVTGTAPEFRFVVIEAKPPFEFSVVSLAPDALALAEAKVDRALELWKRCLDTNVWTGYPKDVAYATLPGWMESQWLEKEGREAA
jgi:hypothetical protein